jgi:hypothetical protein
LNELWEGLPKDPIGKLLWDLDISGQNKQFKEKMEKRRKVFDISNYVIHFSALKRKEISEAYYQFLEQEHNTDGWDFIMQFNLLKKLNERGKFKDEKETVDRILNDFILPKSPKDLCLNEEIIKELNSKMENRLKDYPSYKYFNKIYQEIKLEHQLDSFKRFMKNNSMIDILAKYQHDIEVMTPVIGVLTTYSDEDFTSNKIESKDIEFISTLIKNSTTWDSIYTSEEMKIAYSSVHWFKNVEFLTFPIHSFQFEIFLPFPLQQVANGYLNLNRMNKIDSNISKSKLIYYQALHKDGKESATIEMEMVWNWGTPMKKRNVCYFKYYPNELVFVSKPIKSEKNWFNKEDSMLEYFEYEIITLSEIKGNLTKFQHVIIVSSENMDWKKCILERGKSFFASLKDSAASSKLKIVDEKEKYLEWKGEDPKDAIGMMLYNLDIEGKSMEYDDLQSERSVNETSFLMDDETSISSPNILSRRNSTILDDEIIELDE